MPRGTYTVVIADDSADFVVLLKDAFEASGAARILAVLSNGQQVIDYFEGKGRFSGRRVRIPDVLILDLQMPLKNGLQVLEHLRARGVPMPKRIAILTAFTEAADVLKAYKLGVHFLAAKEPNLNPFVQRVERAILDELAEQRAEANSPQLDGDSRTTSSAFLSSRSRSKAG